MAVRSIDCLEGEAVEQIWFWAASCRLVFRLGEGSDPEMYVDSDNFELISHGTQTRIDVADNPLQAGAVLALLKRARASA
jgi:hypothetical protein